MRNVTVSRYMTAGAHTIGHQEPLTTAHRMLNEHGVRHLPVLENGRLVGVVSQRDLHFLETLKDVDPSKVSVEEAMTPDVFTVTERSPLRRVALEMSRRKLGSAVVLDRDGRVAGIFTAPDGLRALAEILGAEVRA